MIFKKMNNNFVAAITLSCLALACSNDEAAAEEFSKPNNLSESGFYCYITGKTVTYNQATNDCITKAVPGSTATFIYKSSFTLKTKSIKWNMVSAEPRGSISINGNSNEENVSITFAPNFENGIINATGINEKEEICGPNLIITKL